MKKQDKTPVLINLVSTIRDEEGEQEAPMQLFCRGELKKTASGYLIRYQESMPTEDDSEMVTSDVILSLSEHRVTMSRPGEYGTTMVFVKDQRFEGAYHTPFGDMAMAVFPTQVKCRAADDAGMVHLEYQLDVQGASPPCTPFTLTIARRGRSKDAVGASAGAAGDAGNRADASPPGAAAVGGRERALRDGFAAFGGRGGFLPTGREARLANVDTRRLAAAGQAAESAGYADKNPRRAG